MISGESNIPMQIEDSERTNVAETWQSSVRMALRSTGEILDYVGIARDEEAFRSQPHFPAFATREYLNRVRRGDPHDPLLRQVLPSPEELQNREGWSRDPVGDTAAEVLPGLLHKYHGRVLLITSGACAIHCRYCFRQHFPYDNAPKANEEWTRAIEHIAAEPTIREVILSGGDPLMVVDQKLARIVRALNAIPHLKRLRIHTRLPIVIPNRVCDSMLEWIQSSRLACWVVLHINHPQEIDPSVEDAIVRLRDAGCQVLNQSVLLRGVNDQEEILVSLSERLIDLGIVPYYLHQLDRVQGAGHFEVPLDRGLSLIEAMRRRLPGFAVPRYVSEVAGESSKHALG